MFYEIRYFFKKLHVAHLRNNCLQPLSFERGAAGILPLMFSTAGGALFLFSFYNLTQYTASRSAVDQAARKAARCLSPSDGECRSDILDPAENPGITQTWFGYQKASGPTTIQLDKYSYQGRIYSKNYGASFNSYEILTGNPALLHQEKRVKPQRFLGLLNSYQKLKADVTIHVRNRVSRVEKSCRLKEAVELPAVVDFNSSATYLDTRWCNGKTDLGFIASESPSCTDVGNGQWELNSRPSVNNSYCLLTLPAPRNPGEFPWLQLGGDPVCDGDPEAPFTEIPQSISELNNGFQSTYGTRAEPGSTGRAYPVTGTRQFVVVEVYSCNPTGFLQSLTNQIKTKNDLIRYFTSYASIDAEGYRGNPDFDQRGGTSAFIYNSAPGVSFLAEQDWTYFEWSRQADGARHLERKVCRWMSYEEASRIYPEFQNGSAKSYRSGAQFAHAVPSIKFFDAPSCLPAEVEEITFNCLNRSVLGQPGAINDCLGWAQYKNQLENEYEQNVTQALNLNSNINWIGFDQLSLGFKGKINPRYSTDLTNTKWEFSWTNQELNGVSVVNPQAVRNYLGANPKSLPESAYVKGYERNDGNLDPKIQEKIRAAVIKFGGVGQGESGLSFTQLEMGGRSTQQILNVWPFLADNNQNPLPVSRPYVNKNFNGSGFDFNLDCKQDQQCGIEDSGANLEQVLRAYASAVVPEINLQDPGYRFDYEETFQGSYFLSGEEALAYPECSQFKTLCQEKVGKGPAINLGESSTMPESCRRGDYLNCYPEYNKSKVSTLAFKNSLTKELAINKALSEIKKLIPGAVLCEDLNQANCVVIEIEETGNEVQVSVKLTAALTTPFTEILGQDILTVAANKREIFETKRLNQKYN